MGRRTIADRYARLEARGDELAGEPGAGLSPVHLQTVDVLTDLLEMGETLSGGETPASLRALMGMIRRLRPEMLRQLGSVPPDALRAFMADLIARMQTIVDTCEHDDDAGADPGTRTA